MKRAFIVFSDFSVAEIRASPLFRRVDFGNKKYDIISMRDYWMAPDIMIDHEIYIHSPPSYPKDMKICIMNNMEIDDLNDNYEEFFDYNNKTDIEDLWDAETQLKTRWRLEFDRLMSCFYRKYFIDSLNKVSEGFLHVKNLINEREKLPMIKSIVSDKRDLLHKHPFALLVRDEFFVEDLYYNDKISDEEYIISYHDEYYHLVKEDNGFIIPNLNYPHEIYMKESGSTLLTKSKYGQYKKLCDAVWNVSDYDENTPFDILYDVYQALVKCWWARLDHLLYQFIEDHRHAINSVANKIVYIKQLMKDQKENNINNENDFLEDFSIGFVVFEDLSIEKINILERLFDNRSIVQFGLSELIATKEGDFWNIPELETNETYIFVPKSYEVCKRILRNYKTSCFIGYYNKLIPLSDLYRIELQLRECWFNLFDYMVHCKYNLKYLNTINDIVNKMIIVRQWIRKKEDTFLTRK